MLLLFVSEIANRSADNVSDASFFVSPTQRSSFIGLQTDVRKLYRSNVMLTSTQKCPLQYGCHSVTYTSSFLVAYETCWQCIISKCSNDVTNVFHFAYSNEMQHSMRLLSCVQGKMTVS